MRNNNKLVSVLTKRGKPRRVEQARADEIVAQGGKFISKTRYKAALCNFKVPEKLFKNDRAVKDFISKEKVERENKSQNKKGKN